MVAFYNSRAMLQQNCRQALQYQRVRAAQLADFKKKEMRK